MIRLFYNLEEHYSAKWRTIRRKYVFLFCLWNVQIACCWAVPGKLSVDPKNWEGKQSRNGVATMLHWHLQWWHQVCWLRGVHSIFTLVTLHLLVTTVFATLGDKYWNSWLVAGSQGVSLLLQAVRAIWGWGWSATVWWKSSTKLGQWYDGIWYALQALSSRLWVWQADVDGEQLSEIIRLQSRKPW